MTYSVNAVGVFCEDVREEKSGQVSIVGIYPDTVQVPSIPGHLAKISFYLRAHYPLDVRPTDLAVRIEGPGNFVVGLPAMEQSVIEQAAQDSKDLDHYGIIVHGTISPFMVSQPGIFRLILKTAEGDTVAGHIRVRKDPNSQG